MFPSHDLEGEEKAESHHKSDNRAGSVVEHAKNGDNLVFWRGDNKVAISTGMTITTSCYTMEIPPLKESEYDYELMIDGNPVMNGKIEFK